MIRAPFCVLAGASALVAVSASAQTPTASPVAMPIAPAVTIAPPTAPVSHPGTLPVEHDTLVRLMVMNEVSTRTTKPGDRFPLRVDENVVVSGVTVIPVGAKAWGEVLSAEASGIVGKSGKLNAKLLYVELGSERVPLSGEAKSAGNGGTAETVMGVIGLGPFGLLARGNNAKLKAGDIFNGYFASDMLFDPSTKRLFAAPAATESVVVPVVAPVAQ